MRLLGPIYADSDIYKQQKELPVKSPLFDQWGYCNPICPLSSFAPDLDLLLNHQIDYLKMVKFLFRLNAFEFLN